VKSVWAAIGVKVYFPVTECDVDLICGLQWRQMPLQCLSTQEIFFSFFFFSFSSSFFFFFELKRNKLTRL